MHYDLQQNGTQMEGSFFFDNDLFGFMEEWFLELQIVATKSITPGNRALKPVPERGVKRQKHIKGNSMLEALLHFGGHLCLRKDVPPKCTLHSQTSSRPATQGHVRTSQQSLAGTVI